MLKKITLTAAILFTLFQSNGQVITIDSVYQHNLFSVSLRNGFNKAIFEPVNEPVLFESKWSPIPSINFDYQWNVHPAIGISLNAGFGFMPFRFSFGGFAISSSYPIYGRFLPGINYHKSINDRTMLNTTLRGGILQIGSSSMGFGFQDSTELTYKYIGNNLNGAVSAEAGLYYLLRNNDLIGFSTSFEYVMRPIAQGSYFQGSNNAQGKIVNKGHNIGISLTYTFSKFNKRQQFNALKMNTNLSKKDAKKEFHKVRRFIDPASIFVGVGGTFFGLHAAVTDPNNFYNSNWNLGAGFNAIVEKGITKNYFVEMSGEAVEYNHGIRGGNLYNNFGYSMYWVGRVSFGGGKRFILKESNRNIFNVHAGLSINYTTRRVGQNANFSLIAGEESENYFELIGSEEYRRQIFPSIYAAIEKDFKLSRILYFSLKYKFDCGFMDVYNFKMDYRFDESSPFYNAISTVNGTTQGLSIGFKFKY